MSCTKSWKLVKNAKKNLKKYKFVIFITLVKMHIIFVCKDKKNSWRNDWNKKEKTPLRQMAWETLHLILLAAYLCLLQITLLPCGANMTNEHFLIMQYSECIYIYIESLTKLAHLVDQQIYKNWITGAFIFFFFIGIYLL